MRQFDIVRLHDKQLAVILQSDLLDERVTRVAAPLIPSKRIKATPKLHISIRVGRQTFILAPEKLSAIERSEIKSVVGTAADRDYEIRCALDLVFIGV